MNVSIPPGVLDEQRVLDAELHVFAAWIASYRHLVSRFNRQPAPGVWEPTNGVVKRPKNPAQEAALFGGHARFDEVLTAGLIVAHPEVTGAWMPFGYPVDAEVKYAAGAMKTKNATEARAASRARKASADGNVTLNVTDNVTLNVSKTRQDKTRPEGYRRVR